MKLRTTLIALCLGLHGTAVASALSADTAGKWLNEMVAVKLNDGTEAKGRLVDVGDGRLILRTAGNGRVSLKLEDVQEIQPESTPPAEGREDKPKAPKAPLPRVPWRPNPQVGGAPVVPATTPTLDQGCYQAGRIQLGQQCQAQAANGAQQCVQQAAMSQCGNYIAACQQTNHPVYCGQAQHCVGMVQQQAQYACQQQAYVWMQQCAAQGDWAIRQQCTR